MHLNSKVAVVIAAAVLLLGMSVATAVAAVAEQQTVALKVGQDFGTGFTGTFGSEIDLQPAVISNKAELPSDKFHFQAYVMDVDASGTPTAMTWKDFQDFEDIQLEDTNTVSAFPYRLGMDDKVILSDGSAITPPFPYLIRAEYKAFGNSTVAVGTTSTAAPTFSETETVTLIKNDATRVAISTSGAVKRAGTKLGFRVSANCGVGTVRVTISKAGSKTLTYNLATSENGYASGTLKLGTKNGTYKVSAKFLGNVYGVASPAAVKTVRANR